MFLCGCMRVRVHVRVLVRPLACSCACTYARVHVYVRLGVRVHAICVCVRALVFVCIFICAHVLLFLCAWESNALVTIYRSRRWEKSLAMSSFACVHVRIWCRCSFWRHQGAEMASEILQVQILDVTRGASRCAGAAREICFHSLYAYAPTACWSSNWLAACLPK